MISSNVIFLNPNTNFLFLKVANLALLIARWLVVILTIFRAEWNGMVLQGILTLKDVLRTSHFSVALRRFM